MDGPLLRLSVHPFPEEALVLGLLSDKPPRDAHLLAPHNHLQEATAIGTLPEWHCATNPLADSCES
jgi:hypothetical protein